MLKKLGDTLKKARQNRGASLQVAALPAQISGAYLHKLEQGKVDTPSPRVLRRLADELDLPYLHLLQLAGYLDQEDLQAVPAVGPQLTPSEKRAVDAFIKTLVAQRD